MDGEFVRNRITELRMKKGISEYKLSYELGHSKGYIYNISSGHALPPLMELFAICEYFGITPSEFFDENVDDPTLIRKAIDGLRKLNDSDQLLILNHINRLLE